MDTDGDGHISIEEFVRARQLFDVATLSGSLVEAQIERRIEQSGRDGGFGINEVQMWRERRALGRPMAHPAIHRDTPNWPG